MKTPHPRKEIPTSWCPPHLGRFILALVGLGLLVAVTVGAAAHLRTARVAEQAAEEGRGPALSPAEGGPSLEPRRTRQAVGPFFAPKTTATTTTAAPASTASTSSARPALGYYEEQRPVLVHAEGGPILAYRQPPLGPPRPALRQDPFYGDPQAKDGDDADDDDNENDNDNAYDDYDRGRQRSDYDEEADGGGVVSGAQGAVSGSQAARGNEDSKRPVFSSWGFATPTPPCAAVAVDRKLQPRLGYAQNRNRDLYDLYGDYDYPYMGPVRQQQKQSYPSESQQQQSYPPQSQRYPAPPQQQQQQNQQYRQQPRPPTTMQQNRLRPSWQTQARRPFDDPNEVPTSDATPPSPVDDSPSPAPQAEAPLLSVVKQLKTMWDLYRAFSTAWDTFAAHRERTQQQQQQLKRQQQQQEQQLLEQQLGEEQETRINSRQPPKFVERRKQNATTTTTMTTKSTPEEPTTKTSTTATTTTTMALPPARNEPRQGDREKRQSRGEPEGAAEGVAAAEGRYIKGDPLKGYYDFVITEGSYKFWAAFQVATAILIIYSTFAAIYYSKVNPLVSDYDYTDYLGGARSLSGGDLDFVDDEDATSAASPAPPSGRWLQRAGHSLQFVLDAIDRLPVDHEVRPQ